MKFSKLANSLSGSATMAATLKAQELKAEGEDILLASVGEPDLDVDPEIKQALSDYLKNNPSKYGSSQGLASTRNVLSKWFLKIYGAKYSASEIIITPGSKFGLYSLLQILCEAGDEVIIPAPYWVSYVTLAEMAKATPIVCQPDTNYKLTAEKLKETLNQKSKVLILNSPNNPTGAVYSKEELRSLYNVLKDFPDITVICDDIYNQINFSSESRAPSILDVVDDEFKKQIVIVHGASKSYAMTGWRMGWIAGPSDLIKKLAQFYSQTLTCTPDFIQKATETALQTSDEAVEKLKQSMIDRHQFVLQGLKSVPNIKVFGSAGAFYIWIELLNKSVSSMTVVDQLLKHCGIAGVPGEAFGMPFHFRLAVTLPKADLQKLIDRLSLFFTESS